MQGVRRRCARGRGGSTHHAARTRGACESGGAARAASADDYPSETLEWTIAFGPGGGNDIMARTIVDILQKDELYPENIVVENREGGSGAIGWGYLSARPATAYAHLLDVAARFITTPLQADTGWTPDRLHARRRCWPPTTSLLLLVKASPTGHFEEWVEYAKKGIVVVGGIGTVNVDFILPTDARRRRRATRSSTSPTTRRASCRPRCSPAPWTR